MSASSPGVMSGHGDEGGPRNLQLRELNHAVDGRLAMLRDIRRDLHRHPEPGWTEFRTTAIVVDHLRRLGFGMLAGDACLRADAIVGAPPADVIARRRAEAGPSAADIARPGVVGILERGEGPTVALRFDMDATEVAESTAAAHRPAREGFASERPGAMHACGHDGHVSIGIGVAEVLADPAFPWRGRVKLIFQPAEEGGRGARPMAEAGVVDDVDYFVALHIWEGNLGLGHVALEATEFLPSVKLDAEFSGLAAHPVAAPEKGRNALLAASAAVLGLHALPRHSRGGSYVNVGVLQAGSGRNVVAARGELRLEVRGDSDEICQDMEVAARRVIEGAAAMHGVDVVIREAGRAIGGRSDHDLVSRLRVVATSLPETVGLVDEQPQRGSEDATFFMRRVQDRGGKALYFVLGADARSGHHMATFDFDERALGHGVKLMAGLAIDLLS